MHGDQPSTCLMWVPTVPFFFPLLSSSLSLSHSLTHNTLSLNKINPLSQHSLTMEVSTSQVMFYINLYLSYVIYLLSEVITTYLRYYSKYWEYLLSFVNVNIVINSLLGFKKKFNIVINYWEYLIL